MLKCDLHDYLEIICMFHYNVKVVTKKGASYSGLAEDVLLSDKRQEVLRIKTVDQEQIEVVTEEIEEIQVITPNARFQTVRF